MYHLDVFRLRRHLIIHLPRLNMDLFTKLNIVHAVVLQSRYIRVRFWCGETLSVTHKERRGDLVTPKSKSFQFKMLKSSLPKVLPKWNPSLQLPHKTIQNLSCSAIDKSTRSITAAIWNRRWKKNRCSEKMWKFWVILVNDWTHHSGGLPVLLHKALVWRTLWLLQQRSLPLTSHLPVLPTTEAVVAQHK